MKKINLIRGIKYIVVLLVLVFVATLNHECSTKISKTLLASYTLELGFSDDVVSVFVLNDTILKDEMVTSSEIVGLTDVRLEFYNIDDYIVIEDGHNNILKKIEINNVIGENLLFVINKRPVSLKIDTLKGRYIGVTKLASDSITLEYSKQPRYYD